MARKDEIMQAVLGFFKAQDWTYEQNENVFDSGITVETPVKTIMLRAVVGNNAVSVIAVPDVTIPQAQFALVKDFANALNARLPMGAWLLDEGQAVFAFRYGQLCLDGAPGQLTVEELFGTACDCMEQAGNALLMLLEGSTGVEDAVAAVAGEPA